MDWINCEFIGPPPKGYDSWSAYLNKSGDKLEGLIIKAKDPESLLSDKEKEEFKKQVKELFKARFYESWMDEDDLEKLADLSIKAVGGWDCLYEQVEIGIRNGVSAKKQIEIVIKALKPPSGV